MKKLWLKLKSALLVLMLVVFACTPLLTGCDLNISSASKLRTPTITLSSINKSISWNEISGAENYEIYLNDTLADTIAVGEYTKRVYDFSSILDDSGEYSLYVIATTSSVYRENSEKSNTVEYTYVKNSIVMPTTPNAGIGENEITFTINDGVLSFVPLSGKTDVTYSVYAYSNTTGLNEYPLPSTMYNLIENNIINKSEIYAIRVAYKEGSSEDSVIASDIKYYNNISAKYEGYTDKIYLFDGEIHDYYIENQQELNNLVYYAFINRITSFNIRISEEYKTSIYDIYRYSSVETNLNYAVDQGMQSMYETMCYEPNNINNGYVSINGNAYQYNVKISYYGITECDLTIDPTPSQLYAQARATAYYETTNYTNLKTKYGDDYDDFASDKQFLYTTVTTSEQLYWAVENKITPVFAKTNTRAYQIYNTAKDVLREIISDEMTDYEKALSIFDWICLNTQYDYTSYTYPSYPKSLSNQPIRLPCFYLEGVFTTGYSVCDGFSKAFSLMCNMIGIDCIRIVGDAVTSSGSGGHAWNKVLLDKDTTDSIPAEYYLVDITWTELTSYDKEETLSHTYFGLSDSEVANTHFAFTGRNGKYNNYKTGDSLYYYDYQTYTFQGTTRSLIIDSDDDMKALFDYALVEARDTIEFVVDYDYMVSVYNAHNEKDYLTDTGIDYEYMTVENGKKQLLQSAYDRANDTYTYYFYSVQPTPYGNVYTPTSVVYYNYKLRCTFQDEVMKKVKFDTQYFSIADENSLRVYNTVDDEEKMGMMFVFTQSLLIDNEEEWVKDGDNYKLNTNGEIAKTIQYFDDNNITGEYYFYIEEDILNYVCEDSAKYTENIASLFNTFTTKNVKFEFTFVSDDELSVNDGVSILFIMTVSSK